MIQSIFRHPFLFTAFLLCCGAMTYFVWATIEWLREDNERRDHDQTF